MICSGLLGRWPPSFGFPRKPHRLRRCWPVGSGQAHLPEPRSRSIWVAAEYLGRQVSWLGANRRLIGPLLGDYGLISLLQQGTILIVTAIAGLRATAAFRGARRSARSMCLLRACPSFLSRSAGAASTLRQRGYPSSCFGGPWRCPWPSYQRVWPYISAPPLGELVLGEVWQFARPLILPFAFVYTSAALNFGATTGLRLIGEAGQSFRVRIVATPLMLITVAVACSSYGVTAAVWAQAMAGLVATGIWWWTFVFSHGGNSSPQPQMARDAIAAEGPQVQSRSACRSALSASKLSLAHSQGNCLRLC